MGVTNRQTDRQTSKHRRRRQRPKASIVFLFLQMQEIVFRRLHKLRFPFFWAVFFDASEASPNAHVRSMNLGCYKKSKLIEFLLPKKRGTVLPEYYITEY